MSWFWWSGWRCLFAVDEFSHCIFTQNIRFNFKTTIFTFIIYFSRILVNIFLILWFIVALWTFFIHIIQAFPVYFIYHLIGIFLILIMILFIYFFLMLIIYLLGYLRQFNPSLCIGFFSYHTIWSLILRERFLCNISWCQWPSRISIWRTYVQLLFSQFSYLVL